MDSKTAKAVDKSLVVIEAEFEKIKKVVTAWKATFQEHYGAKPKAKVKQNESARP
jgi:hypothetical protein